MKSLYWYLILVGLILLNACQEQTNELEKAKQSINEKDITEYIKTLGSDEFMGRRPFSEGEEITVNYLKEEFNKIGLEPVNGSYFQEVPLVEVSTQADEEMLLKTEHEEYRLKNKSDFVAQSRRLQDELVLENSPLVFAGYGIVAPEYDWNDYENLDVKGKTVVVLVNDPGFVTEDSSFFKGRSMTYYGRWTYKYEEAARQGAEGVLIIHQTEPAGYPWNVVENGASVPELYLVPKDDYQSRCKMEGWLTLDAAKNIFKNAGIDFSVINEAAKPDFKPINLNTSISLNIKSQQAYKTSKNVLGYIKGSKRPDEVIIYSAHWDHLGIGKKIDGDSIYNGAVDNGTSLAWMMAIAKAFKSLATPPERSVMFFAPTAEESGLLGSAYYAANPLFEIEKTAANINNDLMLPYGATKDVMVTGYGQSELDDYVARAAKKQGRYIMPDPNSHTGMYFRSDHFSFAKHGVPSLFVRGNCDHVEQGKDWMKQKENEWLRDYYHKPTDEYEEWWDLSGIVNDAQLLFEVGYELANEKTFPQWNENSEFKDIR
jgi:Zn-dependent M28 family amino/carboxypeptidase